MFRKDTGRLSFSFSRLMVNSFPVFANNSSQDIDLTPAQQDALFIHQLRQPDYKIFDDESLLISGVVERKQHSITALRKLRKIGIISPTDGSIHTNLITKHLPNQIAELSIHRQRRLIALLFFWEEELTRWRLLEDEEAEIKRTIDGLATDDDGDTNNDDGVREELKVALATVWLRRSTRPSLRDGQGSDLLNMGRATRWRSEGEVRPGHGQQVDRVGQGEVAVEGTSDLPPAYGDYRRTVSISGGPVGR